MKCLLTAVLLACNLVCFAQKRKSPKCPPAARSSRQYFHEQTREKWFLKAEGGVRHSLMYRNDEDIARPFRFISRPQPYVSFASGYSFNSHWGIFLGVLLTETMQGLQFRYSTDGYRRKDNVYRSSIQFRYPIGVTYSLGGWKTYLGFAPIYNSFYSTLHNGGSLQAGTASPAGYSIKFPQADTYDSWDFGFDATIEKKIRRRLYANLNAAIDFYPSVPSSATVTLDISATHSEVYEARAKPYLFYIGCGLSYRILSGQSD